MSYLFNGNQYRSRWTPLCECVKAYTIHNTNFCKAGPIIILYVIPNRFENCVGGDSTTYYPLVPTDRCRCSFAQSTRLYVCMCVLCTLLHRYTCCVRTLSMISSFQYCGNKYITLFVLRSISGKGGRRMILLFFYPNSTVFEGKFSPRMRKLVLPQFQSSLRRGYK